METVPQVMHSIRTEMRRHRQPDLSVPQFRTLAFLKRHEGTSLSAVADHVGLTLPSMSKLIDGLVVRKLVSRQISAIDRRCVTLMLSSRGKTTLESAYQGTQARLSEILTMLSTPERTTVARAMHALRRIFTAESREGRI
jgi:DNA-binding MarR family transcriptional regulator